MEASKKPGKKMSPLSIGIIVLSVFLTLAAIGIVLFYFLVMEKRILCKGKGGKIVRCKDIPTAITPGETIVGKSCVRVIPPDETNQTLKDYYAPDSEGRQRKRRYKATNDGRVYTEIDVAYPAEIKVNGKTVLDVDSPSSLSEDQIIRVKAVALSDDFTKLNLIQSPDGQKVSYDLNNCTFDGLSFKDYIGRVLDTENQDKCDKLSADFRKIVKKLYPDIPDSHFKDSPGSPIWNAKCYKGMGAIPAGDWMCKPEDCTDDTYGKVFDKGNGKHCMILNKRYTNPGTFNHKK